MRFRGVAAAGLAACVGACAEDDSTGPQATLVNGIQYRASVGTIQSSNSAGESSLVNFAVVVTLENITSLELTRTYPAACPVRVRLYLSGVLSYDETRKACASDPQSTLAIPGSATRQLSSGTRFPASVLGDSLPNATYTVRAVVMTESSPTLEIPAGTFDLRRPGT